MNDFDKVYITTVYEEKILATLSFAEKYRVIMRSRYYYVTLEKDEIIIKK